MPRGRAGVTIARPEQLNEPDHIANTFIDTQHTIDKKRALHYHRDNYWKYTGTHYELEPEKDLKADFHAYYCQEVKAASIKIKNLAIWNAALAALQARTNLRETRCMPSWTNEIGTKADHNHLAFQNGILNLEAALKAEYSLLDHTPEWFSATCLPFDYSPLAQCPQWTVFLYDVFEGDQERINLLQEWFGYCLTPDTSRQKFMLLEGAAGSGKGTIKEVLVRLLGERNCSFVRLEMFSDKFQMRETVGKLINVIDETDKIERMHEGIFKTYVGEGLFFFDVKHKDGFQARPTARLLILSNDRLPITDRSQGMWRRMLLLPFKKSFTEKEDPTLLQKLCSELPGVFNWALMGLARLRREDKFTSPKVSEAEKEAYKLECNPAKAFLLDHIEAGEGDGNDAHSTKSLYESYQMFCKESGNKHPLSMTKFNREVTALFPQACRKQERIPTTGKRAYVWKGIRRKKDD
jgi:putative DNA primase/helicase